MTELKELLVKFNDQVTNLQNDETEVVEDTIEKINSTINECSLQVSILTSVPFPTHDTLLSIKQLLLYSGDLVQEIDYDALLEFLNNLIQLTTFDDILETFTVEDLQMALKSPIISLVQSACLIVSLSYPKGILASTIIFDILLDLYFKDDTEIIVINAIDKIWYNLSSDKLVRDNILKNNLKLLQLIKQNLNPLPTVRLLNLLAILLEHIDSVNEFNSSIFLVSEEDAWKIIEKDILLFLHVIKYYTEWFIYVNNPKQFWLLDFLKPVILSLGQIFDQKDKQPQIVSFAKMYLFKFFQKVSYLSDLTIFKELDEKYLHVSIENDFIEEFLSFINPEYLYESHRPIIEDLVILSPSKLPIIRNLVSDENTFNVIKTELTSVSILSLPYPEQMVLLQKMTQYEHSVKYLILSLPKVMSNLIDNADNHIIEPETVQLRTEAIDNLLKFSSEELNVWYQPLKDEFVKIRHNVDPNKTVQASVASAFIQ
ncbi:DNA mismatch repair protein Hsm3p [Monosporozyma servazzii]